VFDLDHQFLSGRKCPRSSRLSQEPVIDQQPLVNLKTAKEVHSGTAHSFEPIHLGKTNAAKKSTNKTHQLVVRFNCRLKIQVKTSYAKTGTSSLLAVFSLRCSLCI
jgi:hypothetical protein